MSGFPPLDTDTLYVVIAAAGFVLSLLFLTLRSVALRYRGLTRWALSDGLIALGFLMIVLLRDSPWMAHFIANSLIICGVSFLSNGVWAFLQRPARVEPLSYLPAVAATGLFAYFTFIVDSEATRSLIFSVLLLVQFGATATIILYRYPFKGTGPARFTAIVFIVLALLFAYGSLISFQQNDLLSKALLITAVGLVAWTLGLGIMVALRLAEELSLHEQEVGRLRQNSIIKNIIDTIPQSIVLKDRDSRFVACNAAFSQLVGLSPAQLIGLRDIDLYPPELAEKYVKDDQFVMGKGNSHEFIERSIKGDEEIWVETVKTPSFGPNGDCEGVIVVFRDISQRKKDEERLQESEQRYRELSGELETRVRERTKELEQAKRDSDLFFDVTLEYLCLADFSGRFLKLSPSWSKNLGWNESELMNKPFFDFVHKEDRLSTLASVRELATGGRIMDKANRFRRADGSWVWMSWSAVGLPERGIVLASAHDITARIETEERMRIARETAEAANQAKSQFISTMSHELRTPLNAVLGYTRLLAQLVQGEQTDRYLKSIESSGKALLAIINDLLDLTKVESGRLELTPAPFEPRKLMDEIGEIFRFGAEEKGLYIEFRARAALPKTLLMDSARLRQILINLIGNSIKFTDRGSVRVSLDAVVPPEAAAADEKTMYSVKLLISVEDTGIGMSEQYRLRLFEPFSQQDAGIARKYGGTGLGLAIAKRLLDLMKGSISCESEMNRGTRFSIEIPEVRAAGRDFEVVSFIGGEQTRERNAPAEKPETIRGRVLLVCKNDDTAASISRILESPVIEISIARDYPSAVEQVRNADIALIEFDPKLFLMLQEDPAAASVPTVLIIEKKHREDAMLGFRAGAVDFLYKPIDAEELRSRVRVHLDLKKARDALERKNAEISEGRRAIEEKNNELETLVSRLDRLSMTDELTGLSNRRAISERLAEEVARAKRAQRPITVLMGDLDRFKLINDRLGHAAGDAVLAESARRFAEALRGSDCLGRWGGEEFLAVLPETDSADALTAAERARERVGDTPIAYDAELVRATISIGAAFMVPSSSDNTERCAAALIRSADEALYRAKAKGRNRVEGIEAVSPSARPTPPTEASSVR